MKHNVLGRVRSKKQMSKSVALARQEAFEARKETLLVEQNQNAKANVFLDRRIGGEDASISEQDKMLMRFPPRRSAARAG